MTVTLLFFSPGRSMQN